MRTAPDSNRRAAVASLPSLMAIGAAFFLPFVKGCDTLISPLQFSMESASKPIALVWVLPRFAVAALLAMLTLVLIAKKRAPGRASERLAVAGLANSVAALGVEWWMVVHDASAHRMSLLWAAGLGLITVVSGWLLVGAWRHREWARWERMIAAHAALSSPLCAVVFTAGSWRSVGPGGYAYVTSIAILLFLFVLSKISAAPADLSATGSVSRRGSR